MILVASLVAIKFNEDDIYSNEFVSKIGGIDFKELNKIEEEFLDLMDFELWVDEKLFLKYKSFLVQIIEN